MVGVFVEFGMLGVDLWIKIAEYWLSVVLLHSGPPVRPHLSSRLIAVALVTQFVKFSYRIDDYMVFFYRS